MKQSHSILDLVRHGSRRAMVETTEDDEDVEWPTTADGYDVLEECGHGFSATGETRPRRRDAPRCVSRAFPIVGMSLLQISRSPAPLRAAPLEASPPSQCSARDAAPTAARSRSRRLTSRTPR